MKFAVISIAALFISFASATYEQLIPRATNSSSEGRLILGSHRRIYLVKWASGTSVELNVLEDFIVPPAASWMSFARPNLLYVADESSATLQLYELDLDKNKLTLKAQNGGSSGVVHLEFNADKTRLLGSAYRDGAIDVWKIESGRLDYFKAIKTRNKDRKGDSHPHQATLDPTGRFFVVNDLGTDSIIIIDSKDDAYEIIDPIYSTPRGCGPRHGVFYPQGSHRATSYIVVCEKSNQVLVYSVKYEGNTLALKQIQAESTFSNNFVPANKSSAAAGSVVLTPDNQNLYVTNRLMGNETDYITSFRIDTLNSSIPRISFSHTFSTHGLIPRMISLSSDGKYLFAANEGGTFGLVAMKRTIDGTLKEKPVTGLWRFEFRDEGPGPQFVQQIR
ncbi:hypothetical protein FDECE_4300 [Fusarium decemcellulare]|nr:hypothetical protein FDECE_4300 [Fusarium decemcellulare]